MTTPYIHTLVYIGAGNGDQLTELKTTTPKRLVLIEPLPSHINNLFLSHPYAEIWKLAISCQHNNQPATLIEFNLSSASSLHQPSGLLQLYPGIKAVREHQVQTQTPSTMMETLNLPEHEPHQLIIEANGEEAAIVQDLIQKGLLQQFKQVQLTLPAMMLYSNGNSAETLAQQLQVCHFELTQENTEDPNIRIQLWQFNALSFRQAKQQKENAELNTKVADIQQKLDDQARQNQQLKEQRDELLARQNEQDQQIAILSAQLEQEQNKHAAASSHAEILSNQQAELNTKLTDYQNQRINLQAQLSEAEEKLNNAHQTQQSTHKKLAATEQALADSQNQLTTSEGELSKYKGYFQERKKQHEAAVKKINDLSQQLVNANVQISAITQQQQADTKLGELEQKMEQLFASLAEQLRQNTNALGQHVTQMHASSNRQWQATLAVQHCLSFGEQPLLFTDTSISPELAQQLVRLVKHNNYDLIIEFGSGHSTSLLARILLGKNKPWQNGQLALQEHKASMPQPNLAPREHDLTKRIISFEHNNTFYQQTRQVLQQQGLNGVVELVHAPLVCCRTNPEHLFYDCETRLQQLATLFQEQKKHILVLVDGPSAEQVQHSRTPALPLLLDYFARHKLDVVLDDHHRESEQHSAEQWRYQLAARSLNFNERIWDGEKSALLISINP